MTASQLSSELKVACQIYQFNLQKEPVWFGKLVDSLKDVMPKNMVSAAVDTLTDWMIVEGHYGATEKGRAGYLFQVSDSHCHRIRALYEEHWKVK